MALALALVLPQLLVVPEVVLVQLLRQVQHAVLPSCWSQCYCQTAPSKCARRFAEPILEAGKPWRSTAGKASDCRDTQHMTTHAMCAHPTPHSLGANVDVDVAMQYLALFMDTESATVPFEAIRDQYAAGKLLSGEVKDMAATAVNAFVAAHQARRAALTDQAVASMMTPRKLPFTRQAAIMRAAKAKTEAATTMVAPPAPPLPTPPPSTCTT